jgi:HD-like signal output (HDOD) protein/ActR/RegA family two-component response regulator
MSKCLLFVDDEENVLSSLRRTFFDTDYELLFATSGQEGLDIIKKERVDMVVSDMRMPGMDGYSFLKAVKEKNPSIVRIILSGYAEKQTVLKAIVDGTAKAYLTKPWNNDNLRTEIAHFFEISDTLSKRGLSELINRIGKMPVLPESYQNVIKLIEEDTEIDKIATFIAQEPGYAVKLLAIANSSFYGVKVGSVKQAIIYLGLDTVKNIILSSEIFEVFRSAGIYKEHLDAVWEHSKLTSKILHMLYFQVHMKRMPEDYSSAGLLHDIGRLLILRYLPSEFSRILNVLKENPKRSLIEAESEVMGAGHTHLGGYLLEWWNLPNCLVETCLYHHTPQNQAVNNKEIMALCHMADILSRRLLDKDIYAEEIDPEVFKIAGITEEQSAAAIREISSDKWS